MQVSVIIPVYNAERFLKKAVLSAESQKEVSEILLVEDKSPDNSLHICKDLEKLYPKVRLVRHEDGENHGAAETRNLGIKLATFDYIAFLGADEYYLTGSYDVAKRLFDEYEDIDGVYEATGTHFYNEDAKNKWFTQNGRELTTIIEKVNHNELFEYLFKPNSGYLHLDGLVVKKNIFNVCGYFPAHLKLHQDTAFFIKLAAMAKLISGRLEVPVSVRGIHSENRILGSYDKYYTRYLLWKYLFCWAKKNEIKNSRKKTLFDRYINSLFQLVSANKSIFTIKYIKEVIFVFTVHPYLFLSSLMRKIIKNRL